MIFLKTFESMFEDLPTDPFSETLIDVLNMDKLNKEITRDVKNYIKANDAIKAKEKEKSTYFVEGPLAIVTAKKGGKAVVDNEMVGQIAENDLVEMGIYEKTENGGRGMYPAFDTKFSIEELKKFIDKQQTVKDFMGKRFDYNDRVQSNQRQFYTFYQTQ